MAARNRGNAKSSKESPTRKTRSGDNSATRVEAAVSERDRGGSSPASKRTKGNGDNPSTAKGRKAAGRGGSLREPSQEDIARRAYGIWECQGRPQGSELDHWLQAEHELRAQHT